MVNLGSIIIYIAVWLSIIVVSLMLYNCREKLTCQSVRNFFDLRKVWSGFLTFVHAVFFELSVSVATSQQSLGYFEELNGIDRFSMVCSVTFMALLTSYLFFGLYFFAFKAGDFVMVKRAKELER